MVHGLARAGQSALRRFVPLNARSFTKDRGALGMGFDVNPPANE